MYTPSSFDGLLVRTGMNTWTWADGTPEPRVWDKGSDGGGEGFLKRQGDFYLIPHQWMRERPELFSLHNRNRNYAYTRGALEVLVPVADYQLAWITPAWRDEDEAAIFDTFDRVTHWSKKQNKQHPLHTNDKYT